MAQCDKDLVLSVFFMEKVLNWVNMKTDGSRFLGLAQAYFWLCSNICKKIIQHGNKATVACWEGEEAEAKEIIAWSDARVIVPLLFNFYHGLELFMKAVLLKADEKMDTNHDLGDLLAKLKNLKNGKKLPDDVMKILEKYLEPPSLVKGWMKKNGMEDLKQLLEFLRYPTDKNFSKNIKYLPLQYKGKKEVPFYKEMEVDLQKLIQFR